MKITKVCCQGCGADLDVDEGIRFVTCNYCGARLEVVQDATVTHTRHIENIERATEQIAGNLKVIELQNDLERLDREWMQHKDQFMVRNKDGSTSEPGGAASVIGAMLAIGFGLVWTVFAASMGAPGIFPLFGLVFVGVAVVSIVTGGSKARQFQTARADYESRRAHLVRLIDQARNT